MFVGVRQHQISQELQLVYDQGAWNVVGGLYYMRENVDSPQEAYADAYVNGVLGLTSFTAHDRR